MSCGIMPPSPEVRMRQAARTLLAFVAVVCFTPAVASAEKYQVTPGTPQYTNVENAIKFLREHGITP